ncbi:MAG: LLM class flavin-dependent oxidoreductase [Actinobacteria bacterium]|nr:LLM class flavin-dependent oxidoreductase [Actinomycetota bacterium]
MGIVESVRAVMWARKRQPEDVAYGIALAHERFGPRELLEQAAEAERAGFDIVCCSDHLAPWWDPADGVPAHCASAWVWLGAAGHATSQVSLGPAVSAIVHRYNPVVMAQQAVTLELLHPGRAFLAVGSGEAMNEVPAGLDWPPPAEQLARTEEALTIITGMLHGETVTHHGRYFRADAARLYDLPPRRVPVYMSAFGPKAAAIAGRLADGVWTLAHPVKAPRVIAAYRKAAEEAGREPGEIILQGVAAAADSEDLALESSREWKGTLVDENYAADVSDPAQVGELGEENVSDRKYKMMAMLGPDPGKHVRQIKAMQAMGATAVVVMNVSGADPLGTVRLYGEHVLPELRSLAGAGAHDGAR